MRCGSVTRRRRRPKPADAAEIPGPRACRLTWTAGTKDGRERNGSQAPPTLSGTCRRSGSRAGCRGEAVAVQPPIEDRAYGEFEFLVAEIVEFRETYRLAQLQGIQQFPVDFRVRARIIGVGKFAYTHQGVHGFSIDEWATQGSLEEFVAASVTGMVRCGDVAFSVHGPGVGFALAMHRAMTQSRETV